MSTRDLPVEDGFRQRGQQVARIEAFVDAAFAFALTLLVIVQNEMPDTMAEVREALRRIPTFIACFVLIALFWAAHNRWSRRCGLVDAHSTVLSLALVLVVLVYVYPLRMVVSQGLSLLTGGWVPSELRLRDGLTAADVQTIFIVYSVGFGLMALLIERLDAHALRRADALQLDACEAFDLHSDRDMHRLMAGAAGLSLLASLAVLLGGAGVPRWAQGLPMWIYAVMGAGLGAYWHRRGQQRTRLRGRMPPDPA